MIPFLPAYVSWDISLCTEIYTISSHGSQACRHRLKLHNQLPWISSLQRAGSVISQPPKSHDPILHNKSISIFYTYLFYTDKYRYIDEIEI